MSEDTSNTINDDIPEAIVVKHHRFSLIWVVPVIALLVAAWLGYKTYSERGTDITITFEDGSGLVAGKTIIEYRGVQVGIVNSVFLDKTFSKVVIDARLDKSASGLATDGAAFWVVRPEISVSGVRGLDTLLTGPYIGVSPGDGKTPKKSFVGLEEEPALGRSEPGLNILLQSTKLGSLQRGSPVYYREFKVGEVDQVSLASDAETVHVHVHIEADYENLVRENSRFWNASGIGMDLGLFGAKVKTESLQSILSGGLSFATPPNDQMGGNVPDGTVFKLYDDPEDEWSKWQPSIPIVDTVAKSQAAPASQASAPQVTNEDSDNTTVTDPAGTQPVNNVEPPKQLPHGPHHQ